MAQHPPEASGPQIDAQAVIASLRRQLAEAQWQLALAEGHNMQLQAQLAQEDADASE